MYSCFLWLIPNPITATLLEPLEEPVELFCIENISYSYMLKILVRYWLRIRSCVHTYEVCPESIGSTFISPRWCFSSSSNGWHPSK